MVLAKEYRDQLTAALQEKINKLTHCQELLFRFLQTNEYPASLETDLRQVNHNLQEFFDEIAALYEAISKGNERFRVKPLAEVKIWPTTLELEKVKPTHRQKALLPVLINCLRDIHGYDLPNYIVDFNSHFTEVVKMIRGGAGTGKTHGLAHCVEKHLEQGLPALIIQAKNTPCSNWTEILSHALEVAGWNKFELLSALESTAISRDVSKAAQFSAGEELQEPTSKVLICIDGLEEETGKESDWCSRISETTVLSEKYPRLRFLFSARSYFRRHCIDAHNQFWEEIDLPGEGDVPVREVAEDYLKRFKIELEDLALIKGIDSLLALRLFCEEYEGSKITLSTHIVTAARELLRLKVERINREFLAFLQQGKGVTQQPVFDALLLIAELYYHEPEIEHTALRTAIHKKVGDVFTAADVELMLDFFVRYGILIRISRQDDSQILPKTNNYYRITYQSIIEHILSEKIYHDIRDARIEAIPDILHKGIIQPLSGRGDYHLLETPPNLRIIQSIVNRLFTETGRLIGEDDFLIQGFSNQDILRMQFEAIRSAPSELAIQYKESIDKMFLGDATSQFLVLKSLIIPSANKAGSVFGSEYVHEILMNRPSAFERDKLWSGLDNSEAHVKKVAVERNNVKDALSEYGNIISPHVIVRQGFRAIIEKAFLTGSVSEHEVKKARPVPSSPVKLIDLNKDSLSTKGDECYPIMRDLAWYVIKNAYNKFLEYPSQRGDDVEDNDCDRGKELLDLYRKNIRTKDLYAHNWTMAAAIAYIRNVLGLTREDGSSWTKATHGTKSKVFTYEEKYTWLAVHYLQGYLSDYVPIENNGERREWVKDYSQITDIPNPGEEVLTGKKIDRLMENANWIIKEYLARTIDLTGNINDNIKAWVDEEPTLNFANWLQYDSKDFPQYGDGKTWIALRSYASLKEASKAGYSQLVAWACLIKETEFKAFKALIESGEERRAYFITHLDGLHASPDTDTYSNPSDIVWMDWIEEYSDGETLYLDRNESKLFYTITGLTQDTVEGERHYNIPSKLVRKLLGIRSFSNAELMDDAGETVSFIHRHSEGPYEDTQEIVLADEALLLNKLKEQGLKILWLVDFFKRKNPLNKTLEEHQYTQKSRKYMIWLENGEFKVVKFWEEYYTNQKDKKRRGEPLHL